MSKQNAATSYKYRRSLKALTYLSISKVLVGSCTLWKIPSIHCIKRVEKVFKLRYFSDEGKMTWNKISNNLGISIQTAINLHDRGAKILKKKMKSCHSEDFI